MPTKTDPVLKSLLRTAHGIRLSAERSRKLSRSAEPNIKRRPRTRAGFSQ